MWVDLSIVILLREDNHSHLRNSRDNSISLIPRVAVTDPQTDMFLNPDKRTTPDIASPSQKANTVYCSYRVLTDDSMELVEYFKVSFGKTTAFIYKYEKAHVSGLSPTRCHDPGASPETAAMKEYPWLQDFL